MARDKRKDERKLGKAVAGFSTDYGKKVKPVIGEGIAKIAAGQSPLKVLRDVWESSGMDDFIASEVVVTASIGASIGGLSHEYARGEEARRLLLRSTYGKTKPSLFKTLAQRTPYKAAREIIQSQVIASGKTMRMAAELAAAGDFTKPTVTKLASELITLVRSGQGASMEKAARKLLAHADRLSKDPLTPTQYLKKAYVALAEKALQGDELAMEKVFTKALEKSARYNAERIARTESAAAYGQAQREEMLDDPTVGGCRFLLDARHSVTDECDFYAEADLYGLGAGIYPKGEGPILPIHPNGLSTYIALSVDDVKNSSASMKNNAQSLAASHPAAKRIDLGRHIQKYERVFAEEQE